MRWRSVASGKRKMVEDGQAFQRNKALQGRLI